MLLHEKLMLITLAVLFSLQISTPARTEAALSSDICLVRIAVLSDGGYLDVTHNGSYKRTLSILAKQLRGGCYNDANPSPVTAVAVRIAPTAPQKRVNALYETLQKNGWPKDKVRKEEWEEGAAR